MIASIADRAGVRPAAVSIITAACRCRCCNRYSVKPQITPIHEVWFFFVFLAVCLSELAYQELTRTVSRLTRGLRVGEFVDNDVKVHFTV